MSTKASQEYAENTLDEIDRILDFIEDKPTFLAVGSRDDAARRFKEAMPAVYLNGKTKKGLTEIPEDPMLLSELWPFDYSVVRPPNDFGAVFVYRIRSISQREALGKVTRPAPRILRMDVFFSGKDKPDMYAGHQSFYGIYPNGTVTEISKNPWLRVPEESIYTATAFAGMSVSSFYDWHVVIGRAGSDLKIKLPATPTSAREFLSLRDVPEGYQRRAAIKHWVSKHERRRETPEEYDVRAHLRGREEFTWGDYEGWIEPSQHDLKKATK